LPRGRVVIELASRVAPQPRCQHQALAARRSHYFDGLAIIRVQDNYVVQWDDAGSPSLRYRLGCGASVELIADAQAPMRVSSPWPIATCMPSQVGFLDGFPAARDPTHAHGVWLAHCYGMVGAGRDDTSGERRHGDVCGDRSRATATGPQRRFGRTSAEGRGAAFEPAARQRRNGVLCSLGAARFPSPSMRIASDVPTAERTPIEVLRTEQRDFPRGARAAARSARAVVQVQSGTTSISATCPCPYAQSLPRAPRTPQGLGAHPRPDRDRRRASRLLELVVEVDTHCARLAHGDAVEGRQGSLASCTMLLSSARLSADVVHEQYGGPALCRRCRRERSCQVVRRAAVLIVEGCIRPAAHV
jgi:hypothetical protein